MGFSTLKLLFGHCRPLLRSTNYSCEPLLSTQYYLMLSVRVRLRYPKSAGTAGWIFLWFFLFFSLFLFVLFVLFFFSAFHLFFFLSASNEHLSLPRRTQVFIYIFYLYLLSISKSFAFFSAEFQVFDFIKMPV